MPEPSASDLAILSEIFQQIVHRYGGAVRPFSQYAWRRRFPTSDLAGLCNGLCVVWIEDLYRRLDFMADVQTPAGHRAVMNAMIEADRDVDAQLNRSVKILKRAGLGIRYDGNDLFRKRSWQLRVVRAAVSSVGSRLFAMQAAEGAHSIAMDTESFRFFDPVVGEAQFPSLPCLVRALVEWLRTAYHAFVEVDSLAFGR